MLPIDRFKAFISQHHLFQPQDKVLLAVSGGRDSVLMVHLFHACGFPFGIAHCNFMLRGAEAEADEAFTMGLAKRFNAPLFNKRFDTTAYSDEHGVSIQMAARSLRFAWLEQIRRENQYRYIATAHHQNDAMETTLLNLVRGTGIAGLHGILPKREALIRPLLFLTREEIDVLVDSMQIPYRDDASNFSSKYARNKIRLEVIPKLKELNPNLEATFEANAKRFSDLEVLLNERVAEVRQRIQMTTGHLITLPIGEVTQLRPIHTLLYELLKPFSFTEAVVGDLIRSLGKQPGLKFESETHLLVIDRGHLIISEKNNSSNPFSLVHASDSIVSWCDSQVAVTRSDDPHVPFHHSARIAVVDAEKLQFPLVVRSWQAGDAFYPLGLKGKKKLSDYFINQKIPLTEKRRIPILVNGNGDIIWVLGRRLDDRYKVGANTKKVYIFEWK